MATRPHLLYSQLNTYATCSLRYYYQYVEGLKPAWTPAAIAFGSAVHEGVAALNYSRLEGAELSQTELDCSGHLEVQGACKKKNSLTVEASQAVSFSTGKPVKTFGEEISGLLLLAVLRR